MYKFGFQGWAESNVENDPTFRQILQLPTSEWICNDIGQAVVGELDFMVLIGGAEERAAIQ
jgi:hypothetical protein